MTRPMKIVVEIVQFVPIITLASSFIVKGGVDLDQVSTLFWVSGIGAAIITGVLYRLKVLLNPILLATNLWLVFGAVAFGVPIPFLADLLTQTNAILLFAANLVLGIILTVAAPKTGFIGTDQLNPAEVKRLSILLLGVAAAALLWAVLFKDNIRLGGGLPFILLNVTRRMMIRRASATQRG